MCYYVRQLDKLVLCLYEGSCHEDSLVEAHSFEFTYSAAGVSLDVRSAGRDGGAARSAPDGGTSHAARFTFENIRESTLDLLKSCIDMSQTTHREMQEPYDISLRLYYNNGEIYLFYLSKYIKKWVSN